MGVALIVVGAAVLWLGQALGLSLLMSRLGFHPLPWFVVPLLIGPAVWPLALIEAVSGPPAPQVLHRGKSGSGRLDIFVLLGSDHVPERIRTELTKLMSRRRRLVIVRVIKAGGPGAIATDAERFLRGILSSFDMRDAELQLRFGDIRRAATAIEEQGHFVLRDDRLDEMFDPDVNSALSEMGRHARIGRSVNRDLTQDTSRGVSGSRRIA